MNLTKKEIESLLTAIGNSWFQLVDRYENDVNLTKLVKKLEKELEEK